MTAPSWKPPAPAGPAEEAPPGRPVLDDLPPWMPGGLVAAEFTAGMDWPDCQCRRCVPRRTAGGGP